MNVYKQQAVEVVDRLHEENRLDNSDYCTIHDGLSEIEPRFWRSCGSSLELSL